MRIMECLSILSEAFILIWVLHRLLHKKIRLNFNIFLFLFIDVLTFWLINQKVISASMQIFAYIFLVIYIWLEFNNYRFLNVLESMLVTIFITGGIQFATQMLLFRLPEGNIRGILIGLVELGLAWIVLRILRYEKIVSYIMHYSGVLRKVLLYSGVLIIVLMILFKSKDGFSLMNCLLVCTILLLVSIFSQQWKIQREKIVFKEREIRVLKQANDSFEHLMNDVQARQHEFKNQLEAIYSLHYVCDTYEELVERQNEYVTNVLEKNRFNTLLTMDCSPVIKGFLYFKFGKAQQEGILVDYHIHIGVIYKPELEFDVQECLGILFDNAQEAVCAKETKYRIFVNAYRDENAIIIKVENPSSYVSQAKMELLLKGRYSTKGENRGYGLHNVKEIAQKHNGFLSIENKEKEGQNWFCVTLNLYDV